ncbi:MAG: low molecular weight phosphotyrosine protein phosphatase [Deltaproteobacteria bacterium]|nr:low molecular weight phosphotyrosine protein phosphatase [Deltaproteobacteria bacterium]
MVKEVSKNPETIERVLVVCTGNICRSPMAEGLMIERLRQEGKPSPSVLSAGIFATPENLPDPFAVQVAGEEGIDISGHRARVVNNGNLSWADIVLVMEAGQREFISMEFPRHSAKVVLLGNFGSQGGEIADPYGASLEAYRACFGEIREALSGFIQFLSSSSPRMDRGIKG